MQRDGGEWRSRAANSARCVLAGGVLAGGLAGGLTAELSPATAQIVPDTTLPTPSIVTELDSGQMLQIDGGTVAGTNLFHSFERFEQTGALSGSTVRFDPGAAIENIFTRVTGGSGTVVDGLLQTVGDANFYLIDPRGIHFGENSRLNIGGTFVATSADRVEFADGTRWPGTAEASGASLLTVSAPIGLQFETRDAANTDLGRIEISGAGNRQRFFTEGDPASLDILDALVTDDPSIDRQLLLDLGATIDIVSDTTGLTAPENSRIALIGREIAIAGGRIAVPSGTVDLAAIAAGTVPLNGGQVALGAIDDTTGLVLGDITLSDAAAIDTSGTGSESLRLWAHDITFDDGSVAFVRPLGSEPGGRVELNANGDITFQGVNPIDGQGSGIIGGTLGRGRGTDLALNAENVTIRNGGFLSSTTFASGSGGDTTIAARDRVEVVGTNGGESLSVIFSDSAGIGTAGNIEIAATSLRVADGAQLTARSLRSGRGGNIRVEASDRVELSGFSNQGGTPFVGNRSRTTFASGLFVIVEAGASGDAGNIDLTARSLEILRGGQLVANTSGSGNAGNVTIRARDNVSIVGASASGVTRSNVASSIRPGATGNGGQLDVETSRFELLDTAFISVTSFGDGQGGSLNVRADTVTVRGASATNELIFGGIFAEVRSPDRISGAGLTGEAFGNGGSVSLTATDRVSILDGGAISVLTDTTGNGGDLTLRADTVEIGGVVEIPTASPDNLPYNRATISAGAEELGRGGTLLIDANQLIVRDGGLVSVGTQGSGNAGNLTIVARESAIVEGVRTVTTNGLTLLPSTISASSENTVIGPASGNAGSLELTVGDLVVRDGGRISVSSDNQGSTGDLWIQAETIALLDDGRITAESVLGDRGNIQIDSDTLQLRRDSRIDANATREATGGNVSVSAETIAALEESNISANAVAGSGGRIEIETSGLFLSSGSTIEASSQFGVNGIVAIDTPDVDSAAGLVELDTEPADPDRAIADTCSATARSGSFTNVGRDGFPENLTAAQRQPIPNFVTPQPLDRRSSGRRAPAVAAAAIDPPALNATALNATELDTTALDTIAEARSWMRDPQGRPVLSVPVTPEIAAATGCRADRDSAGYFVADAARSASRR